MSGKACRKCDGDWAFILLSAMADVADWKECESFVDGVEEALSYMGDDDGGIYDVLYFNEKLHDMNEEEYAGYARETVSLLTGFMVFLLFAGLCDKLHLSDEMRLRMRLCGDDGRMRECLRFIYYHFCRRIRSDFDDSDAMFRDGLSPEVMKTALRGLVHDGSEFMDWCKGGIVGLSDEELFVMGTEYVRKRYPVIAMAENSLCGSGIYYAVKVGRHKYMESMDRLCVNDFLSLHEDGITVAIYSGPPKREHIVQLLGALSVCGEIREDDTVLLACYDEKCANIRDVVEVDERAVLAGFKPDAFASPASSKLFATGTMESFMFPSTYWFPMHPDNEVLQERLHGYCEAMAWESLMRCVGFDTGQDDEKMRLFYDEYGNFVLDAFGYGMFENRDLSEFLNRYECSLALEYLDGVAGPDKMMKLYAGVRALASQVPTDALKAIGHVMSEVFSPSAYSSDDASRREEGIRKCRRLLDDSAMFGVQVKLLSDGVPADDILA